MDHTTDHVHIIVRSEVLKPAIAGQGKWLDEKINKLIRDVGMEILIPAQSIWTDSERDQGFTGIACLTTSHTAYHFWNQPQDRYMHHADASLLQYCMYTCGKLDAKEVFEILSFVNEFEPVRVESCIIDRATGLAMSPEKHLIWDANNRQGTFREFLSNLL